MSKIIGLLELSLSDWLAHIEELGAQRCLLTAHAVHSSRLTQLQALAHSLGVLNWNYPVITVAGTNGKGSCVHLLATIFQAAGYRVGSFTSPHLVHYNERIQINHQPVTDAALCSAFAQVEQVRGERVLGYFEFTTLTALWLFKQAKLDVIVLEVGLGGRLDPVNLVDSDLTIVSSIDFDHMHLLGDTLESIAFEKAGVMRSGKPCIWGQEIVPDNVQVYAKQLGTPLKTYGKAFGIQTKSEAESIWTWWNYQHTLANLPLPSLTHLPNAACVLQTIDELQVSLPVSIEMIRQGLQMVSVPGRFQVISDAVTTILDVAHNPASARLLAENLRKRAMKGCLRVVVAMMRTKDIHGTLKPLIDLGDYWYLAEFESVPCASVKDLKESINALGGIVKESVSTVEMAYTIALQEASPGDTVLVFGSFHTVGAVIAMQSF
jgi:dihydrofolate synthase/folylpolyglutamate synthase